MILSSRDVANASTETAAEATVEAGKRAFVRIGEGERRSELHTRRGPPTWARDVVEAALRSRAS